MVTTRFTSNQCFSSKSSKHHKSQTIRGRDLKIVNNVQNLSRVTCHVSPVTCYLSPVTCHLSPVTCSVSPVIFFNKLMGLVIEGSVINRAYPSSFNICFPSKNFQIINIYFLFFFFLHSTGFV